ncbi:MAG: calcineurin-like phosphoesterase C-terminal domain-containing protein [Bacteroidales bacterium]|nr:calcineurin-like phosphoesterase C-terminal domain-containing protein [Bacteroidales bacterium]
MKKVFYLLLSLAVLSACRQEDPVEKAIPAVLTVECIPGDDDVKTSINANREIIWGDNEYVRLWYNDGKDKFAASSETSASAASGQKTASFTFSVTYDSASSYEIGGFYPASCYINVAGVENTNPEAVKVTLPAAQVAPAGTFDPTAYLMVMQAKTVTAFPTSLTSYWKRCVSLNQLTLTNLPENATAVEIICPGKDLAGKATINLKTGKMVEVYEPSESVTVQSSLSAGTAQVYFTSWDVKMEAGESIIVRVIGTKNSYTKAITANSNGITFAQGRLCRLNVSFAGVEADHVCISDFASQFISILDTWKANTGTITVGGGDTFSDVYYVPADWSMKLGAVSYNKSNAYDVAIQSLYTLYNGGTMADALPAARGYAWGDNPYNEGKGNGGAFQNTTVDLNFLLNFASREIIWTESNNKWSNFCWYTDASGNVSTKGTPQVSGYKGVCSLERSLLIMARFYKYLIDNEISDNIATACASMQLNAALYDEGNTPTPVPATASIGAFAQQFVKVLDVWNSSIGTVKTQSKTFNAVHYVPESTTITFNGKTLTKAQMFSVAIRSLQALYNGGSMADAAPEADSFAMAADPWLESTELAASELPLETLNSLATRQVTYGTNNGRFANYCGFPNDNFDATSKKLSGMCSMNRQLLCTARFFDYLLDNNITTGIVAACGSKQFSCDLYGTKASIYGYVKCGTTPLKGVVVSDGYQVTATDANGLYSLSSEKKNGYVFISIPSGYKVSSSSTVLPQFFKKTASAATVQEQLDFSLTSDGDQTNHTMLVFGDIHLAARTNDRTQFKTFTTEINNYIKNNSSAKIYALTLGDMTWDQYWYSNSYTFSSYLADVKAISGLQIFHTIGNHDHDMNATGDWNTVKAYKTTIAPNYYSFNIGKVHYMVVDNIECTNSTASKTDASFRSYNVKVVDYILDWIKKDLAYVAKDTPIVVTMHSPVWTTTGKNKLDNADEFAACFNNHTNVRFISGHTHLHRTVFKQANIKECNSGAVCAAWWWGGYYNSTLNVTQDGAPGGYRVMTVKGTNITSYYKGTGRAASYQFRTYDRNKIKIAAADYSITTYKTQFASYLKEYGDFGTASSANQVLINVWDYNTNWKVEACEDNKNFVACTRAWAYDPLYLIAYTAQRFKSTSSPTFKPANHWHMFTYTASSASSTVYIKVTDDEGKVYTETMKRPKTFSLATYK